MFSKTVALARPPQAVPQAEDRIEAPEPEPEVEVPAQDNLEQVPAVPSRPDMPKVERKVPNYGHQMIVDHVLPVLFEVMQDPAWSGKAPLLQARESLRRVDLQGFRFWGANQAFSRKRTVEDAIVSRYIGELRLSL